MFGRRSSSGALPNQPEYYPAPVYNSQGETWLEYNRHFFDATAWAFVLTPKSGSDARAAGKTAGSPPARPAWTPDNEPSARRAPSLTWNLAELFPPAVLHIAEVRIRIAAYRAPNDPNNAQSNNIRKPSPATKSSRAGAPA
jgi:hypothetical protein